MFSLTALTLFTVLASLAADNTVCATPTGGWHGGLASFRWAHNDTLLPTPSLYIMHRSHLVTGQNGGFYHPTRRHCQPAVWTALLLLLAGVEPNPGPCAVRAACPATKRQKFGVLRIGSLNVHSAVRKAAQIHSLIADHKLDVLVIQESHIRHDHPAAVRSDIAPAGYSALHVHRDASAQNCRGGGLAVVHRHSLMIKSISVTQLICCRQLPNLNIKSYQYDSAPEVSCWPISIDNHGPSQPQPFSVNYPT